MHPFFLFFIGIIVGIFGSIAGGSGLVSLPVLLLAGLPTPIAIGTNRLSITILECVSAIRFFSQKKQRFDWKKGVLFGIIGSIGAYLGSQIVMTISKETLDFVAGVTLIIVSLILLTRKNGLSEKKGQKKPHFFILISSIFFLGIYLGFIGGGFGTFITLALLSQGFSFLESTALSRLIGFITSFVATISFMIGGLIDYRYAFLLGVGFAIGAWIGPMLALKKGERFIRWIFTFVVIITAIKLMYNIVN